MNIDTLIEGSKEFNIDLDEKALGAFRTYKGLLKDWNKKINITSITDDVEIDIKHFLDSLSPLITNLFQGNLSVIDVGTGGGFPGIPLKIINENLEVTLLDSLNKRINFLNVVIDQLGLENIRAIHGRAEELSRRKDYRDQYDICISRAVASLDTLSEYCLPFVKPGGHFISMKGPDLEEELNLSKNAIKTLGGQIEKVEMVKIPLSDIEHSLVIIKKIKQTPTKYPRGGGKPRKKPL